MKYKTNPRVGDIITNTGFFDNARAWIAIIFFIFFDIDASLRDSPTRLHPWKSVQPFGAFKADGHRGFAVGFQSAEMFRVEENEAFRKMVFQLLMNSLVFTMKLFMTITKLLKGEFSITLMQSCATSLPSVCIAWYTWVCLMRDRQVLRHNLLKTIRKFHSTPKEERTEAMERQSEIASRMMDRFFRTSHAKKMIQRTKTGTATNCKRCGRDRVPKGHVFPTVPEVLPKVGQHVQLSKDWKSLHDAKYGTHVISPGQQGVVLNVSPFTKGIGIRCRVRRADGKDDDPAFWYDLGALDLLDSFEANGPCCQPTTAPEDELESGLHEVRIPLETQEADHPEDSPQTLRCASQAKEEDSLHAVSLPGEPDV